MSDNTAKTYKADKSAYSMTLRELMSLRARYYKMGVEEGKSRGITGGYDFNNPYEMYRDCGLATVLPSGIPTCSSEITVPEVTTMALCSKLFNYRLSSVGEDYETHVYPEDLKILKIFTRWISYRDHINEMLRNPLTDGRKVSITYSMGPRGYSMPIRGKGVLEALTRRNVYTHDMSEVPYDVLVRSLNLEEEAKKSHGLLLPVGIQQEKSVFPFLVEKGVFWSEASDALRDVLSELYKNQGKSLHEMLKSYLASNDIINAIRAGIDAHINAFMNEHPEYELLGIHGTKAYLAGDAKESYAINIGSGAWGNKITQTNTPNTINETVRYLKEYHDVREDVLGAPNRNFLPVSRVENGAGQGAGAEISAQGDEWCWDARLLPVYVAEEDCVGAEYAYEDLCRGKYALASSPYSQKVKKDDLNVAPATSMQDADSDGNVPEGYMKAVKHSLLTGGAGSSKVASAEAQGEGGVSEAGEPFPTGAPRVFQLKPRPIVMWNRLSKFSTVPDAERKMLSLPTDISRFTAEDVRNYLEFEGVPQSEFVVFNAVGLCDSQISRPMQAKYIGYNKDALFGFMGQYEELFTMEQATRIRGDLNDQYKKSAKAFESVAEYMLGLFPSNAIESEKEAKYRAVNEITGLMRIHTKETKSAYTRLMKTVQKAIKSTSDGNVVALGILEAPFNVDSVIAGDVASDMLYRFQEKLFDRYVSPEKLYSNVRMWCARHPESNLINEIKQLVLPQESKSKSGEPNSAPSIFNPATPPAEFGLTATPNMFPAPASAGILMRLKSYLSGLNYEELGDNNIKAVKDLKSVVHRSVPTVDEIVDVLSKVYSDAQDRYDASFDSIMYMVKSFGFAASFTGIGTGEFEELLAESEFVDFRGWCEKISREFQSFFDGCMHRLFTGDFVFKGGLENMRSVGATYLTAMVDNYRQMMKSVSEDLKRLVLAYSSSDVETIQSLSELPEEALKLGIEVFVTEEQTEEPEHLTPDEEDEEAWNMGVLQNEDIKKDDLSEWETTVSSPCDDGSLDSRMGKVEGFLSGVTTGIQGFSCVVEPSYNPYVGTPALVYNIGNSSASTAYMRYANMVYGGDRAYYKDWGVSAKAELLRNGVSKEDLLSRNPWERGSLEDTIYKVMVSYIYRGTGVVPVPVDVTEFQFDYAVSRVVASVTGIPMAIVRGTSQKLSEYASKNRFKEF